jgi:hypothetical protein
VICAVHTIPVEQCQYQTRDRIILACGIRPSVNARVSIQVSVLPSRKCARRDGIECIGRGIHSVRHRRCDRSRCVNVHLRFMRHTVRGVSTPACSLCHCRADGRLESTERPTWTTLAEIHNRHTNLIQRLEPHLFSVRPIPALPLGQRALLLGTDHGNILWGSVTVVDDATVRMVRALGGLTAIAVSHPRHFSSVVEWSHAFGGTPIYVHATSRRWLMRPDPVVRYWEGTELSLPGNVTLVHVGSYAEGGTLLHWPAAACGRGALLTGDVLQVVRHRKRVGLLSSSQDLVPRSADGVWALVSALERFQYEALYDAWSDDGITHQARAIVLESASPYIRAISGRHDVIDPRWCRIA